MATILRIFLNFFRHSQNLQLLQLSKKISKLCLFYSPYSRCPPSLRALRCLWENGRSRGHSGGKQLNARSVRGNFESKYCFGSASLSAFRVFLAFENTNIYEFRENINLCCLIWEKETIVPFLDATTIEDTHTSEYTSYLWLSRKL